MAYEHWGGGVGGRGGAPLPHDFQPANLVVYGETQLENLIQPSSYLTPYA